MASASGLDFSASAFLKTASRASDNKILASRSSSGLKCGGALASNGKRPKTDWQKEWIVMICKPPGASMTWANKRRAALISKGFGARPKRSFKSPCSFSSGAMAQALKVRDRRSDISPAPALVKVRHKILCGFDPGWPSSRGSSRRKTRSVRTLVLPEPADAPTHTDVCGAAARRCRTLGSMSRSEDWILRLG